uniref:Putative secreted protein n=1 Tax=Amblyomma triste TaxID=251400 RepID=A0A023G4U0_AMBTT
MVSIMIAWIILVQSFLIYSGNALSLGERPPETTTPILGCHRLASSMFDFLPCKTKTLGVSCALLHRENIVDGKPVSTCHNWVGTLTVYPICGLCCGRGDGSEDIKYSFFPLRKAAFCVKAKRRRLKPSETLAAQHTGKVLK